MVLAARESDLLCPSMVALSSSPSTMPRKPILMSRECFQTICQRRVALPVGYPFDGEPDSFGGSYQDCQLLGARQARVQHIAAEQQVVLHDYRGCFFDV